MGSYLDLIGPLVAGGSAFFALLFGAIKMHALWFIARIGDPAAKIDKLSDKLDQNHMDIQNQLDSVKSQLDNVQDSQKELSARVLNLEGWRTSVTQPYLRVVRPTDEYN